MDEDFRGRFRQEDPAQTAGNRRHGPAVPQPGRPPDVTDLRPLTQPRPQPQSIHHRPHQAPVHHQPHHQPQPLPAIHHGDPYPTSAEHQPAKPETSSKSRKLAAAGIVLLLGVAGGGLALHQHKDSKASVLGSQTSRYFPSSITKSQISTPVYYPTNLPSGYKVSGFKVIKQNVLYYSVTNQNNDSFYVTIQPLASDFDFSGFEKKFPNPDNYDTAIGTAFVGATGNQLIGSIQTKDNSWILLNSTAINSIKDMETITRSFQRVSL